MERKVKHLRLGDYFKLPNSGLRLYLAKTVRGNSRDYRTPLFNKASRKAILNRWKSELDRHLFAHNYFWLMTFESDLYLKCGPLSIQKP